ncbi:hypothetical protein L1049_004846 [Liquidambar formosana]|uniref:Protein kinase domain-containing protein n=1 Tax=Liquidambar formosana TaxID=63359 RepID=A0AAP0RNU4_LIQFO
MRRRRRKRVGEMFYRQNGGQELEGILASCGTSIREVKEFTPEEVKSATAGLSKRRILGEGGQGIVYRGKLAGDISVAVKVAKAVNDVQLKEFLRELAILSQLNHKNVVKLLGYCLRLEQPALIYEFLSKGNLSEKLRETPALSWDARMTIVIDVASAIEYLHSEMDSKVFHKDIKSANVLLDQNMVAKLSDFGLSRVVPDNQSEVETKVMGTFGCIEPQFRQFGNYSKECDLFSFGIILAEILTGQEPYEAQRVGEGELGQYFQLMHKDPAFLSIIDKEVLKSARLNVILAMADLTLKCLEDDRKRRPTIRDVKSELSRLLEVQRFGQSTSSWTN